MKAKTKTIIEKILKMAWWVVFILLFALILTISSAKIKGKVPSVFGYSVVNICSQSMEDTIPVNTYILLKKVNPKAIEEGDIICFYSDDSNISGYPNTHRVMQVIKKDGQYEYVTKGDANTMEDRVTAKGDKLIGRYVKTLKGLTWLSRSMQKQGIVVVFGLMLAGTAGIVITTLILKSKEEHQ